MRGNCSTSVAAVLVLTALMGTAWAKDAKEQLKKLEMERAAAVVKGDTATLDKQTSDDYVLISMTGRMADKSQMLDGFKSGQSKLTSNELSDLKVRVYGDAAVGTGKADVKCTPGGQDATGQVLGESM